MESDGLRRDERLLWWQANEVKHLRRETPVAILKRAMGPMKGNELARRSGYTPKHVSEVLNGKAPIRIDFALALERVLGVPANAFIDAQARIDLADARTRVKGLHEP